MTRRSFYFITLSLILTLVSVSALFAEPLSLEGCITHALTHNPSIISAQEKLHAARAKKKEAFAGYLPNIGATVTYMKRNESSSSALVAAMPATFRYAVADELYDTKLTLTQPLFMWGKVYQSNRIAQANFSAANYDYMKAKNDLIYEVKKAYYATLLARQMVTIATEASSIADRQLSVVEGFYKEGRSSTYDVARAKVSLANANTGLIKARNGYELARQRLINTISSPENDIELSGDMAYVPQQYRLDELINAAMKNRPEIHAMEMQEQIMKRTVSVTAAGNKPTLVLTGYKEWQNTEFSMTDAYDTWSVMGVLSIPLFDGCATYQRTKQARSSLAQTKQGAIALIDGIQLEVRSAYLSFKQSQESLEANKENVALAKDNVAIAQERFRLGLMSDIELRDAQFALTQADTNYAQALHDYMVALAAIEKSTSIIK